MVLPGTNWTFQVLNRVLFVTIWSTKKRCSVVLFFSECIFSFRALDKHTKCLFMIVLSVNYSKWDYLFRTVSLEEHIDQTIYLSSSMPLTSRIFEVKTLNTIYHIWTISFQRSLVIILKSSSLYFWPVSLITAHRKTTAAIFRRWQKRKKHIAYSFLLSCTSAVFPCKR